MISFSFPNTLRKFKASLQTLPIELRQSQWRLLRRNRLHLETFETKRTLRLTAAEAKRLAVEDPELVAAIRREIWAEQNGVDKRARNEAEQEDAKRRKLSHEEQPANYGVEFSKEEIDSEGRKPKRKVAVMIGYSGSGYKGMQLNPREKTIEGDLFDAFIAAGAISKANANDPKKSSLVRCARTDKGVHAAGNLISLKLIIEDSNIVKKINENLSPQIRVWGIERTNGSFSAYQFCDSRIYEYLIPTHCFLPPHPESFLGKQLVELAKEADDLKGYNERQEDVLQFWAENDEKYTKPILETLDSSIRPLVLKALFNANLESLVEENLEKQSNTDQIRLTNSEREPNLFSSGTPSSTSSPSLPQAIKSLKTAYIAAKRAYRISPSRLSRLRSVLSLYIGTHNFHNYTIGKTPRDPSSKRNIKSFSVSPTSPFLINNNSEYLSLKVHGQSFMMHQIRKMVSMATLIVRCGCPESRIQDAYLPSLISIPKAPGLGLLLERPLFESYNTHYGGKDGRAKLDFEPFQQEMEEFKQREIYQRIFADEERENQFHSFFASLDNCRSAQLLYLSSVGVPATKKVFTTSAQREVGGVVEGNVDAISSDEEDMAMEDA